MANETEPRVEGKERKYPDDDLWPPVSGSTPSALPNTLSAFPQVFFENNLIECADECGVAIPQGLAVGMVMLRSKHVDHLEMKPPHNFLLDRSPPFTARRRQQIEAVAMWLLAVDRKVEESMEFLEPATPNFILQVILQMLRLIKPCPLTISEATCNLARNLSFFRDGNPLHKDGLEAWVQTAVELADAVTTPKDYCIDQEYYLCSYAREQQLCALNLFNTALYHDAADIVNRRLRDCVSFVVVNAMHLVRTYCAVTIPCFCADFDPLSVVQAIKSRPNSVKLFIQRLSEEIAPVLFNMNRAWFIDQMRCRADITDKRQWVRLHTEAFAVHIMMNILCTNTMKAWNPGCNGGQILFHSENHAEGCPAEYCSCQVVKTWEAMRQDSNACSH